MSLWYVDKDAAGTNAGTSWANAWTAFSSVVWGTGGVVAGDTLYISGGSTSKTYTETWTVGASGSSDNPITIRVGQDAGHTGTVIFDHDALGDSATSNAITCSRNHITFDGSVGGAVKFSIRNLRHTTNRNACYGIYGNATTGVRILYIDAQNCSNPIRLQNSYSEEIAYCTLQARGDAAISVVFGGAQAFDSSTIHHNTIECLVNLDGSIYYGPDGIQSHAGNSIYANTFTCTITALATSDQHTDFIQANGNYQKVYGNTFINVGDSCFDFDVRAGLGAGNGENLTPNNIWFYNNLCYIATTIDPYPEFVRIYSNGTSIASLTNFKILNNTFANNTTWLPVYIYGCASATASGCEIKNNLFYNCGNGSFFPFITILPSSGWVSSDWDTDSNIYYRSSGTQYVAIDEVRTPATTTAASWVASNEPSGSTSAPTFVDAASYDFRLSDSDTVARSNGADLSAYFTTDINGVARSAWDIGAYEYGTTPARVCGFMLTPVY